ncbi:HAD family hydrolase [Actinophytocola gossypii]|uniref:HAD-IA family hydrolase n=1 Tax=Actinophytocola gossypii TaxID=2812003 RepID=A0ABT2JJW6_9PSEU|nr:HAD-IA family hydrolase [Actinophytocola gossypii]MCT2588170.1 HAD-IA family hydrolase [Actinophytocola gossypii]
MIQGVLFDYSGTLFRLEPGPEWLADEPRRDELFALLTASTRSAEHLPAELADDWARRDLDPETHRAVYLAALTTSDIPVAPDVAEVLYERMTDPSAWQPYPDTLPALRRLRAAGVRVAVVSNIAWDIREVFALHGAADLVDEYVLSYEEGVMKPDPKIFTVACQRLGVDPARTLMVGDSEDADGGAVSVGMDFALVEPSPTDERPSALLEALDARGR